MTSKNTKKLESINQKILNLQKIKSQMEDDFVNDISQQIAKLLAKKNSFNIDKPALLKTIESAIDEYVCG